jgi:hypothetical protein
VFQFCTTQDTDLAGLCIAGTSLDVFEHTCPGDVCTVCDHMEADSSAGMLLFFRRSHVHCPIDEVQGRTQVLYGLQAGSVWALLVVGDVDDSLS